MSSSNAYLRTDLSRVTLTLLEIEYTARQTTIQELGNDPFRPYNRAYNANLHDAAHSLGKCSVARNDPEYPICELVARTLARLQGMHRKLDQGWKDWDPVYTAGPASSCLAPWWRTQGSQTSVGEVCLSLRLPISAIDCMPDRQESE
jgi:hypothetical protein